MKRFIAFALLVVVAGCAGSSSIRTGDFSTGFHVVVTIGPTCPVEGPGQECGDKPYETDLIIVEKASRKVVARIRADENGRTGITGMKPGAYSILPPSTSGPPSASPVDFTVREGKITEVKMSFDSGIR
jgi:hypothetical protein